MFHSFLACFVMLVSTLYSQTIHTRTPILVNDNYIGTLGEHAKYSRSNQLPPDVKAAISMGATSSVQSIPHWSGSFHTAGTTYPYTMVGGNPAGNITTKINTSLVPVSLFFDEFVDANGNNIVIHASASKPLVLTSPNFENASYGTGYTQFADAVQRAEFFKVPNSGSWHTLLQPPRMLAPVTVEVPVGMSQLYMTRSGKFFATIDANFFFSQLNTIAQLENFSVNEIPIVLAPNVLLYQNSDPNNCCILGFHSAYQTKSSSGVNYVQTFLYATWVDGGIFQDPDIQDVIALSHEISELFNDPFVANATPSWQMPDKSGCSASLEVGDPIEGLPQPAFEVSLHGFTYHPQTEALLQWFARTSPSNAFDGAYSYPGTQELTAHSVACPQ